MGQIEDRCSCFKKDDKNTFNFEERSNSSFPTNTNQHNTDANAFLAKNRKSPVENLKESRKVDYDNASYYKSSEIKISLIQAYYKGHIFRVSYKSLKPLLLTQLNEKLEKAFNDYRSNTLIKAENYKVDNFNPKGWINYYPDGASKFTVNYGKVYKTKLLFTTEGIYSGYVNIQGKKHGQGVLITNKSEKYEGCWFNNEFTCWGMFIDIEGNIFIGKSLHKSLT